MSTLRPLLEAFADPAQNAELTQLEGLLKRFNLFEAVGVVRHELRHSDFLAFLLDPSQNHGLGASFLHYFLKAALDLDGIDFGRAYVLREWHYIDILIVDEASHFAVIIENKIDTGEHSDQLNRYRAALDSYYPGYNVLALYLTPDGDAPSSPDYQAVSYSVVCEAIENIVQGQRGTLDNEVSISLEHYAQLLSRHVLSDSDIAILCRSIYQKHKLALNLIFENRPDQQAQINEFVRSLIQQQPNLIYYNHGKKWANFNILAWDASLTARGLSLETTTKPYLSFSTNTDVVRVGIWVSPGDQSDRQKVLQVAQDNLLTGASEKLTGQHWSRVTSFKILNANDFSKSQEEIEVLISEKWDEFLQDEMPRIEKAYLQEWLWTVPENPQ